MLRISLATPRLFSCANQTRASHIAEVERTALKRELQAQVTLGSVSSISHNPVAKRYERLHNRESQGVVIGGLGVATEELDVLAEELSVVSEVFGATTGSLGTHRSCRVQGKGLESTLNLGCICCSASVLCCVFYQ